MLEVDTPHPALRRLALEPERRNADPRRAHRAPVSLVLLQWMTAGSSSLLPSRAEATALR
jgi:hypothetical protein